MAAGGVPWVVRQFCGVGLAIAYLWLTGASEATIRATAMTIAMVLAGLAGRRPHPLGPWALAVGVLVVIDPARQLNRFSIICCGRCRIVTLGRDLTAVRQRVWPLQPLPLTRPTGAWCLALLVAGLMAWQWVLLQRLLSCRLPR